MDSINQILNVFFNFVFWPFKNIDPVWGLIVVSFLTSILMLGIFKATSDQQGIKKAKNLFKAHFLAIRLYRDDLGLIFNTMKNIIVSNLFYLKKSLRPMLFLIIPLGLVLIHLGTRYENRPLRVGENTILTVRLNENVSLDRLKEVQPLLPDGIKFEIPPVRIPRLGEINWRIVAVKSGDFEITFNLDGETFRKRLRISDELVTTSSRIASDSFTTTLMNPVESSLDSQSPVTMIAIKYPKRSLRVAGFDVHWLVAFFIFSLVSAFSLKGILGVEV